MLTKKAFGFFLIVVLMQTVFTTPNQFHRNQNQPDGSVVSIFGFQDPKGTYNVVERRVYQTGVTSVTSPTISDETHPPPTTFTSTEKNSEQPDISKDDDEELSVRFPFLNTGFGGRRRFGDEE